MAEAIVATCCVAVCDSLWEAIPLRKVMFAKKVMTLEYPGTGPFLTYHNLVHDPEYVHPWKAVADHEEYARVARAPAIALAKQPGQAAWFAHRVWRIPGGISGGTCTGQGSGTGSLVNGYGLWT